MTVTQISIIVSYVLFISVILFFAPILQDDVLSVTNENIEVINTPVEAGIFDIVVSFINTLISRLTILVAISTSNSVLGIFILAYSVGAIVAIAMLIAEALP